MAVAVLASVLGVGQQSSDPQAGLQLARERLLPDLARLPRYTCTQSITRKYFLAPFSLRQRKCDALIAAHDSREHELSLESSDRLRLEVAIIDSGDVFSWVGAPRFDKASFEQFAGRGPLGSGDFGTFLIEVLSHATVKFEREVVVDGRKLMEFSYEVPVGISAYKVRTDAGWATIGYTGTFRLDTEAWEMASLTVRSAELPPGSLGCQVISEVEYRRTPIHDRMILIPRETRLRAIYRDGAETLSQTSYSSCREYASTSRVLFKTPKSIVGSGTGGLAGPPTALPAGLRFDVRIVTPIDSDTAWAGDPLEAILRSPIRDKKHNLLAPAGTRLQARLVRIEQRSEPAACRLGVQLESMEINGQTVPLEARPFLKENQEPEIIHDTIHHSDRPAGIGIFNCRVDHLRLKHLDSAWATAAPSGVSAGGDNR